MIYRVGDNDHPGYDYSRQKPTQVSGENEKFSLDHQEKEAFSSKKEEKGEDKKLHEKSPEASLRQKGGVKLELSGSGTLSASKEDKTTASSNADDASGSALWNSVLETFRKIAQYAREFFDKIWNDPPPVAESVDVTPEEAERYTEEYYALKGIDRTAVQQETSASSIHVNSMTDTVNKSVNKSTVSVNRDAEIQKYLHSGNLEQVISLLTDNGKRSIAKNSTLLTYYDKSGRLTSVNASDSERILHGDRHSKKL